MTRRRGRWGSLFGAVVAVAAVAWVLQSAGTGQLAPPPLTEPAAWGQWAADRDPLVAALAVLRVLALGAVWYLLVATVVGGLLRLVRPGRLVALADRLTIPALRRLLVATTSVTLAAGLNPTMALAQGAPVAVTTTSTTTTTTTTTDGSRPPPTLTMRLLGPEPEKGPAGPAATITPGPDRPAVAATAPVVAAAAAASATWTVTPGECFWSIADDVLARAWGRAPSDAEIVPYWRGLIEANRAALADRSNADLIFPGQVFVVPPPPPAATR